MKRRLLIDSTVLEFVGRLRKRDRDFLFQRFEQTREFPANYADYEEAGKSGRAFDTHVAGRFAISFWDDFADQHLKIMAVDWADDVL